MKLDSSHFTGASNELRAATYFLDKGCQVYLPLVQQGAVDLVVQLPEGLKRVQVKTANVNRGYNKYDYIQCRIASTSTVRAYSEGDFDLLAVVHGTALWVIPWDTSMGTSICLESTNPDYKPRGRDYRGFKVCH